MTIDRRTLIVGAAAMAAVESADSAPVLPAAQMIAPEERVLGIGGLFFRSHDPKKLAA